MQSAHIVEAFQPLQIERHTIPEVPDEGLLLKTLYAGICHSDIHFIDDETDVGNGDIFRYRDVLGSAYNGIVLGHEICGEILALGSKVSNTCSLAEGDIVIVDPWCGCQTCEICLSGHSNICENNNSGTTDIGQNIQKGGGYSTHVALLDWNSAIKLPVNIPPEVGCMLPCSAATTFNALLRAKPALEAGLKIRSVTNLLIIGAGGLGNWAIMLSKLIFSGQNVIIIVADINQKKLDGAVKAGADDVILWPKEESVEDLVSKTTVSGHQKIDAAIDLVGRTKTFDVALHCLHNGGSLIVIGLAGGELPVSIPLVISRSLSIYGCRTANRTQLQEFVDMLAIQGLSFVPPLDFYKLSEVNIALERLRNGEIEGRALLKFDFET